jgi:hypothetical protein
MPVNPHIGIASEKKQAVQVDCSTLISLFKSISLKHFSIYARFVHNFFFMVKDTVFGYVE